MKVLRIALVAITLFSCTAAVNAQSFRVPDHYSFDSKDSYHKYDKDVVKFVNWLEKVAPGDEEGNVKKGSRFLLEWLSGCNYVHFKQNVRVDNFLGDSPEYRIYYMGGWARYALKNGENPEKLQCTFAGLKMVLKVYKENRTHKRDPNLDQLVTLDEQGKLKKWIEERLD